MRSAWQQRSCVVGTLIDLVTCEMIFSDVRSSVMNDTTLTLEASPVSLARSPCLHYSACAPGVICETCVTDRSEELYCNTQQMLQYADYKSIYGKISLFKAGEGVVCYTASRN